MTRQKQNLGHNNTGRENKGMELKTRKSMIDDRENKAGGIVVGKWWRDGDSVAMEVWRDNIVVHGWARARGTWWLRNSDVVSKEQRQHNGGTFIAMKRYVIRQWLLTAQLDGEQQLRDGGLGSDIVLIVMARQRMW